MSYDVYSAGVVGLASVASATDIFELKAGGRSVRVLHLTERMRCSSSSVPRPTAEAHRPRPPRFRRNAGAQSQRHHHCR